MLLYVHVPFCRRRCGYCAFHSQAVGAAGAPRDYADLLLKDLALWAGRLEDRLGETPRVETVFFGGGTPSLLPPGDVARFLDGVAGRLRLDPDAEITLEANPDSLRDAAAARALRDAGVCRISLGAQSMYDADLGALGRVHSAADVERSCAAVREAGIPSLGLDLMWGLPGQTPGAWLRTLERACALGPDHVSAYCLTPEEGTPLAGDLASGRIALPDEEALEAMFLEGAALLEERGLGQYEISNFARRGRRCRHNLGYWEGRDYLGLGPSAVSTLGDVRVTRPASLALWREEVLSGRMHSGTEEITPRTRLLETVMLRLRTTAGLPLGLYGRLAGRPFLEAHASLAGALAEAGLMTVSRGRAALTRRGMLVSNDVLARLFAEMEEG